MQQLDVLGPLEKQHFAKGFPSYEVFEREVDRLLAAAGCPINLENRAKTMLEQGKDTNCYYWQIDNSQLVASGDFNAISLRDAAQQLMASRHAVLLEKRGIPQDLPAQFPSDQAHPQFEVSGRGWLIRITLMISGDGERHMNAAMLNHKIIPRTR